MRAPLPLEVIARLRAWEENEALCALGAAFARLDEAEKSAAAAAAAVEAEEKALRKLCEGPRFELGKIALSREALFAAERCEKKALAALAAAARAAQGVFCELEKARARRRAADELAAKARAECDRNAQRSEARALMDLLLARIDAERPGSQEA